MDATSQNSFFRIVDAAANRASEGLRVVEDIVRMHLNDGYLASQAKTLRHDLSQCLGALTCGAIGSRDSVGDVGRTIATESEYQREPVAPGTGSAFDSLVVANFKRVQQSLRTLEEFCKTEAVNASIETSQAIEQLRYRSYTIEKACRIALRSSTLFNNPAIYVLVDGCGWENVCPVNQRGLPAGHGESRLAKTVAALVAAGVDVIQLRDKQLSDRQLIAAGQLIARHTHAAETRFVINDRVDLAVACGADGVHVGQEELSVAQARSIIGPSKIIGVSTHSLEQARAAVDEGADYIGVGPVFPSNTKSFTEFVGLELVRQVSQEISLPTFAIGGISLDHAASVAQSGCQRVAVTGLFSQVELGKYSRAASQLRSQLQLAPEN